VTTGGRIGRARLQRRLAVARRGADMLDRKERILDDELGRLRLRIEQTSALWVSACAEADRWLVRAQGIDGRAAVAAAAPLANATVRTEWENRMGVRFPGGIDVALPEPDPPAGGSALAFAARAYRAATDAGVHHAAALRALAVVSGELASTRSRRRAVEQRWIPRMEDEVRSIERALEEQELEEILRLHWVAGHDAGGRTG
jgi:vacuolar-type H+-ATPase subunit D/Vma8